MDLKLKQWWAELTNILYTVEHNSSTVQWQKEPALYLFFPKDVYVVEVVDETLYFTQETFPSPRPPELYQDESLCCFFNREEINFPHDPGETFQKKGVKSIMAVDILLGINQNWSSDRRMIKKDTAGQPVKLSEPAIGQGRDTAQIGARPHSTELKGNLELQMIIDFTKNLDVSHLEFSIMQEEWSDQSQQPQYLEALEAGRWSVESFSQRKSTQQKQGLRTSTTLRTRLFLKSGVMLRGPFS
ncbi:unnamed protein product [Brassica rapa]|uniref:Uncharacterized protein n=1 Tax=Brassica campestris TaxID=3711 RepID=A0A8D9M970_BRACM|nr:unnamed protein product [Brassica rapa]